jgi:hypothetical protein
VPRTDPADSFSGTELECPYGASGEDQVEVPSGTDLSTLQSNWAAPVSKTYILTGLSYRITTPIVLTGETGTVTVCFVGRLSKAGDPPKLTIATADDYGWKLSGFNPDNGKGSGVLGLQHLVISGDRNNAAREGAVSLGTATRVAPSPTEGTGVPSLYAEDVDFNNLYKNAILCWNGEVAVAGSSFVQNGDVTTPSGGAISAQPLEQQACGVTLVNVSHLLTSSCGQHC